MRTNFSVLILALLLTGCDPFAFKKISLNLQPPTAQGEVALSTNDPPVQGALKLIDATLVANGFTRDPSPIALEDQARGLIAFYGICGVTLNSNRLDVGFVEPYKRHFSAPAKKAIEELKNELSSRYGKENVAVED